MLNTNKIVGSHWQSNPKVTKNSQSEQLSWCHLVGLCAASVPYCFQQLLPVFKVNCFRWGSLTACVVVFAGGMPDVAKVTGRRFTSNYEGCVKDMVLATDFKVKLLHHAHSGRNVVQCRKKLWAGQCSSTVLQKKKTEKKETQVQSGRWISVQECGGQGNLRMQVFIQCHKHQYMWDDTLALVQHCVDTS